MRVELAAALGRDRPRLVDHQLRGEEATQRPAREERATLTPIGRYRAFSRSAAAIAVTGPPPAEMTDAAANCAEPAKVVALITTAGRAPMPPDVAESTPNETPNSPTAIASGSAVTAPRRSSNRIGGDCSTRRC